MAYKHRSKHLNPPTPVSTPVFTEPTTERKPLVTYLNKEILSSIADALSDPMNLDSDEELASRHNITVTALRKLKSDPEFMEPVVSIFNSRIHLIKPELFKAVVRRSMGKDPHATKLLFQSLGMLGPNGININIGGKGDTSDYIGTLSDTELDSEISRLLMVITPPDLQISGSSIQPNQDYVPSPQSIEEASYVEVVTEEVPQ